MLALLGPPLLSHLAGAHTQILARLPFSHCYLKPEQACDPGERSHKAVRVRATHCHRGDWARSREQVRCMFPETFLCPRFACPCGPVDSTVPSLVLCPVAEFPQLEQGQGQGQPIRAGSGLALHQLTCAQINACYA